MKIADLISGGGRPLIQNITNDKKIEEVIDKCWEQDPKQRQELQDTINDLKSICDSY